MPWTLTSDDFADDCWTLSDPAYRLHHEGLTWSNRKLLDCHIPKDDLRRFAKNPEAVEELLDVGFWTDEDSHYVIRHHAGYQKTREQVLHAQEVRRKNGAKGGRPRKDGSPRLVREQWEPGRKPSSFPASEPASEPSNQPGNEPTGSGQVWSGTEPLDQNQALDEKAVKQERLYGWDACPGCGSLDPCDCET